jgi:UDP-N-acetylmuramate dehydrogenase
MSRPADAASGQVESGPAATSECVAGELSGRLAALRRELGVDRTRLDEPLAPFTTFRLGGPADLFLAARSAAELANAVNAARALEVPWFVLGLGANILVGDRGFRGLVIRNAADGVAADAGDGILTAESGSVVYPDLIDTAAARGLSGIEHYVGIPSTLGGALWQNLHFLSPAPARERTVFIAEVLRSASILTTTGEQRTVGVDYFQFGYDTSILHTQRDVVLAATLELSPREPDLIRRVMAENLAWRRERHPPLDSEPSAGSIFKKIHGIGAGRLIDECGLKGARVGSAKISERHANFIVNAGGDRGATAADVRALIAEVQAVVERRTGYRLEPEISFIGDF